MKRYLYFLTLFFISFTMMGQRANEVIHPPHLSEKQKKVIDNLVNNMVLVEGGTFKMGATSEQETFAKNSEKPVHFVTISTFYIGKYEVTQEEWETIMGNNPSKNINSKYPVGNVSWDDCQKFIKRLNILTGKQFRLPTEAEWEFAARGGRKSKNYIYSGANAINNIGWCSINSKKLIQLIGKKKSNELNLYDMSGNVWEWCADWYSPYKSSAQVNPKGSSSGVQRVIRGGGCSSNVGECRVSYRSAQKPSVCASAIGFRLVLSK